MNDQIKQTNKYTIVNAVDDSIIVNYSGVSGDISFPAVKHESGRNYSIREEVDGLYAWLNSRSTEHVVTVGDCDLYLSLNSADIFLPFAVLASDVSVSMYLNLLSNYIYDRVKGDFPGKSCRVDFSVEYSDRKSGVRKRLHYSGDNESLKELISRFDVDNFFKGP